jgi:hypothetical protein
MVVAGSTYGFPSSTSWSGSGFFLWAKISQIATKIHAQLKTY